MTLDHHYDCSSTIVSHVEATVRLDVDIAISQDSTYLQVRFSSRIHWVFSIKRFLQWHHASFEKVVYPKVCHWFTIQDLHYIHHQLPAMTISSWWWFQPTRLKKICTSQIGSFPQKNRDEHTKKSFKFTTNYLVLDDHSTSHLKTHPTLISIASSPNFKEEKRPNLGCCWFAPRHVSCLLVAAWVSRLIGSWKCSMFKMTRSTTSILI